MADAASNQLAADHAMTGMQWLVFAAGSVASAVAAGVASALSIGKRVKVLEEAVAKQPASDVEAGKLRDEIAAHKRDVEDRLHNAKADPAAVQAAVAAVVATTIPPAVTAAVAAAVPPAVTSAIAPIQRQVDKLEATHASTAQELTRVRDAADRAEAEGARRWAETSRQLGEIASAVKE